MHIVIRPGSLRFGALLTILFAMAGLLLVSTSADAAPRGHNAAAAARQRRQNMINAATAQITAARKTLEAAETAAADASSRLLAARQRVENAKGAIDQARELERELERKRKSIEAEVFAAEGSDSPYALASDEFTHAQESLRFHEKRVADSEEFKRQHDEAVKTAAAKGTEQATAVKKVRDAAFENDPDYARAKDRFKAAKSKFDRIKLELLRKNPQWVESAGERKGASQDESKSDNEATRAAFQKLPAARDLRAANAMASAARESIMQAENILRSLGAPIPKHPAATPTSSASNKK